MPVLMKARLTALFAVVLSLGAVLAAAAQNYSINWYAVAGGGGMSTNGSYSVNGTIGQADAGTMSGGNYAVDGGYWSVNVVQTPGAPALTITTLGTGVLVSWPSSATNYTLQQNLTLTNAAGWANFGGTISSNGPVMSTTITSPIGALYFRLMQ
jgi:hypothetical protein